MKTCVQCGSELSENAVFCKKCGCPIKSSDSQGDEDFNIENLKNVSVEVREACDRLLASYVRAIALMKIKIDQEEKNSASRITALSKQVEENQNLLQNQRAELERLQHENKTLLNENQALKHELLMHKGQLDGIGEDATASSQGTGKCPKCGEEIDTDTIFCGNCGCKLK